MKRNPIYPLISICFLFLLAYSFFGPHVKYPAGRERVESFGDGSYQILRASSERKNLYSEKYSSCIINNVESVHERRGKAYIVGTDTINAGSVVYRLYAVIDTSENTIQLCIIPPDSTAPDLHIYCLDEMVTNGDAVVYASLDDFSEEDRLVFQNM